MTQVLKTENDPGFKRENVLLENIKRKVVQDFDEMNYIENEN